jgi:hypothetical protein
MNDLNERLARAIRLFWEKRDQQAMKQGAATGVKDQGARSAVTGGAQMDGFVDLVRDLLCEGGIPSPTVFCKRKVELPGFYRPEKQWDLLVVIDDRLLGTVELKSHVGPSFGNNYNNRTEEAIGNAVDLRTAYREGAFKPSLDPWLGFLMLLEDAPGSRSAVEVREPHFKVLKEFREASYAIRYEIFLTKLVRERLYSAACLLLSSKDGGIRGAYAEPSEELSFRNFATSLLAHACAYMKTRGK